MYNILNKIWNEPITQLYYNGMHGLLVMLQMLTPWASLMCPPSPQPGLYEFLAM